LVKTKGAHGGVSGNVRYVPLQVDGTSETKWVLLISTPQLLQTVVTVHNIYIGGDFDGASDQA
jgi:hypothetical protein